MLKKSWFVVVCISQPGQAGV